MHISFSVAYFERGPVMSINNNRKKYSSSKDLHLMHLSFYVTYLKCRPVMSILYTKRQTTNMKKYSSSKDLHLMCPVMSILYIKGQTTNMKKYSSSKDLHLMTIRFKWWVPPKFIPYYRVIAF